jgi:hypothetical protein
MINYTWTFPAFDCIIDEDGLQTVVTTVHWTLTGTDEDNTSATVYGSQAVGQPNPESFTPFTSISKEQVIGWMESSMDVDALKTNLATQINLIKNPVTEILPAPWNNDTTGSL